MKSIVVLVSGSGSNLQAIIDNCNIKYINAEIKCVISNNPGAYALQRANSANIDNIVINHKDYLSRDEFDNELIKILDDLNPDLIVLAGFMRILTEKLTKKFKTIKENIIFCIDCPRSTIWRNIIYDKYKQSRIKKDNYDISPY